MSDQNGVVIKMESSAPDNQNGLPPNDHAVIIKMEPGAPNNQDGQPPNTHIPSKYDICTIEYICTNYVCNSKFALNLYRHEVDKDDIDIRHILCLKCRGRGFYWKYANNGFVLKRSFRKAFVYH